MDSKALLEMLSGISVGSIIAVVTVVSIVCAGCWKVISKLIKVYDGYNAIKDERDQLKRKVEENSNSIEEMKTHFSEAMTVVQGQLTTIMEALNEQRETKITELRHAIVIAGDNALARGEMTIREWNSYHEMIDKYMHVYNQNWYVESQAAKVDRDVRVIGRLDEHGNDIE